MLNRGQKIKPEKCNQIFYINAPAPAKQSQNYTNLYAIKDHQHHQSNKHQQAYILFFPQFEIENPSIKSAVDYINKNRSIQRKSNHYRKKPIDP